eukprot:g14444.t1
MNALSIDDVDVEDPKPTFCVAVGWSGVALYALALAIAGAHLYIAAQYTFGFRDMQVEYVWVFFASAAVSVQLVIYHVFTWQKLTEEKESSAPTTLIQHAKAFKDNFDISGKWFLWILYSSEIVESCNQINNTITIYTCAMHPGIAILLCLLLFLDHAFRAWNILQPWSIARRSTVIHADTLMDLVCLTYPTAYLWFGFKIPISMDEMLMLTLWPTWCILLKIYSLMEENVRVRQTRQFLLLGTKKATASQEKNQGRDSLSRESELEKIVKTQAESVPLIVKKAIACFSCVAGFFFLVTGIFTVSVAPTCDDALYRHCDVRVPFCSFQVSCNCAVLRIQNHNMTVLPPAIESMTAMKKMEVTNGPLEELPKKMGEYMPLLAKL